MNNDTTMKTPAIPRAVFSLFQAFTLAAVAVLAAPAPAEAQAVQARSKAELATLAPDALVKIVSEDILAQIQKDPELMSGNIDKVNALVDAQVLPIINLTRMTALTVGPTWRQAAQADRDAMVAAFREQLVLQYSQALRFASDTRISVLPTKVLPSDTDVVVKAEIARGSNPSVPLDFRLQKTPEGWKVYDVRILTSWVVGYFQEQFSPTLRQGGLPALVAQLREKNASLRAKGAADAPAAKPAGGKASAK